MKTAEEWIKSWDVAPDFPKENLDKHVAILREIQADAFKAGELKGMERLSEACKKKLKEVSKGEYNTWGFVQMFFDVMDKEQEAIRQHAASLGGGE